MEAVHIADCQCYHPNLPSWRTNMDPSRDTWTRTQRSVGPVLYQQLQCSNNSLREQENWRRQTQRLVHVLRLIKKWKWPIKTVLAYTLKHDVGIRKTKKKWTRVSLQRKKDDTFWRLHKTRRYNQSKKIGR